MWGGFNSPLGPMPYPISQLSVKNCFVRGSIVRYIQVSDPPESPPLSARLVLCVKSTSIRLLNLNPPLVLPLIALFLVGNTCSFRQRTSIQSCCRTLPAVR